MRANGKQLSEITSLIESGAIRPVVDKVFPFKATGDALSYVEFRAGQRQGRHQHRAEIMNSSSEQEFAVARITSEFPPWVTNTRSTEAGKVR